MPKPSLLTFDVLRGVNEDGFKGGVAPQFAAGEISQGCEPKRLGNTGVRWYCATVNAVNKFLYFIDCVVSRVIKEKADIQIQDALDVVAVLRLNAPDVDSIPQLGLPEIRGDDGARYSCS